MLRAVQLQRSLAPFFSHSAGGCGERIGLFGFHNSFYYTTVASCLSSFARRFARHFRRIVPYSQATRGCNRRVVLDPIPLVVCRGVALLLVWLWRRLTGR